ncbi:CrpP-related protein [Rhizobium sp. OAE497]
MDVYQATHGPTTLGKSDWQAPSRYASGPYPGFCRFNGNMQVSRKPRSTEVARPQRSSVTCSMEIRMGFDVDAILDWQQRGINARILGRSERDNPVLPYLENAGSQIEKESWLFRAEAWFFGWRIEDASRVKLGA